MQDTYSQIQEYITEFDDITQNLAELRNDCFDHLKQVSLDLYSQTEIYNEGRNYQERRDCNDYNDEMFETIKDITTVMSYYDKAILLYSKFNEVVYNKLAMYLEESDLYELNDLYEDLDQDEDALEEVRLAHNAKVLDHLMELWDISSDLHSKFENIAFDDEEENIKDYYHELAESFENTVDQLIIDIFPKIESYDRVFTLEELFETQSED